MKKTPRLQTLTDLLGSSQLVSGGFLGTDTRELDEMIAADAAVLVEAGCTAIEIADRMQEITDAAIRGLGTEVEIPGGQRAFIDEVKGVMICPWPDDDFRCAKRVTTLQDSTTGESIHWTDLNIHLIREHGFFEGKGSPFRLEPLQLARLLGIAPDQ